MCAVSSGGQGAWSNEASFETPPTLPHPPNDVKTLGKNYSEQCCDNMGYDVHVSAQCCVFESHTHVYFSPTVCSRTQM